jgi:hypothetical protein
MAEFRRVARVEGRAAAAHLAKGLVQAVLAAATWIGVNSYWPADVTEPDEATRARIALFVSGGLAVLAAINLVAGIVRVFRWLRARRWERMLDDPARCHLVPPLETHVSSVAERSIVALAAMCALSAVAGAALAAYGVLALTDRAPAVHDSQGEDQTVPILIGGVVLLFLASLCWRKARSALLARKVEQLSEDAALARPSTNAPAVPRARRASAIPELEVMFHEEGEADAAGQAFYSIRRQGRERRTADEPPHIMYFRLFENVRGTGRFVAGGSQVGYVYLLRSAGQVSADELDAAEETGSEATLFISSLEQLETVLAEQPVGRIDTPPPKGLVEMWRRATDVEHRGYPVRQLLCHGSFWKSAVDVLIDRVDLVVIDLTGYRRENTGTGFELQRVIDRVPIERVMMLVERASDRPYLTAQLRDAWRRMADGSPNAGTGSRTVHVTVDRVAP